MIKKGDIFRKAVSFSQEDVNTFARISGDDNPVHLDEEYAAETIFKKPIIHGFLIGSIFSRIFGTEFPGHGTIYLKQELSFRAPAYVNEIYTAVVTVLEVNPLKHRGDIKTELFDCNNKLVITGTALLMHIEKFA